MKIAMLGHKRIPGREGGVEVVVDELTTRMAQKGCSVTAYNRHKKGFVAPKNYNGVKLIDVPTIEMKQTDAAVYSLLASLSVIFHKYDVVHYHAIGPSAFLLIPHFFGIKTVVTVHGLNYKTPKWVGFAEKFIQFGEKVTAKYADEVIVLSEEQKKYFKEKYNRDVMYIPNGVETENKEPAEEIKEKYNLEKNGFILFLSRVVPGKGLEHLIEAYKKVDTDLPLVIAGGTEYEFEFRRMIEEKASEDKRIKIIGFVEGKILRELYSNARLFVFPSEAEGMPMCLLEAMSYDCPCLVSNIPENLEVGGDFVKSFETSNVEDLKNKLEECLADKTIMNSRNYIQEKYSWDNVVDSTLSVYSSIIK